MRKSGFIYLLVFVPVFSMPVEALTTCLSDTETRKALEATSEGPAVAILHPGMDSDLGVDGIFGSEILES